MSGKQASLPRSGPRRRLGAREFLDAAQHIMATDGFEGFTMNRLARELGTVDSAVYRYFPSKGALIAEIQKESVERLRVSLLAIAASADEHLATLDIDQQQAAVTRLVLFGRWFCATSESYPEDLRLLQMIMAHGTSALDPEGGFRNLPNAMTMLGHGVNVLDGALDVGALRPGSSVDRTIIWAASVGGVLETDDLEKYVPGLFGGTRLAQQASLDLLAGWGADVDRLERATAIVDQLAAAGPLAP